MLSPRDKTLDESVTPAKPRKTTSTTKGKAVQAAAPVAPKKTVAVKKSIVAAPSKVPAKAKSAQAPGIALQEITREDIAKLAYLMWESRGCVGGSPEEDWLKAEALLRSGSMAVS
jgi:hypothetical protein